MLLPNKAAGLVPPCGAALMKPGVHPANIDLMFLVMEQYPRTPRAAWQVAAMLGYFADSGHVIAEPSVRLLGVMMERLNIRVSRHIGVFVKRGWLEALTDGSYRISPRWIVEAKIAPPPPLVEDDELEIWDDSGLPEGYA